MYLYCIHCMASASSSSQPAFFIAHTLSHCFFRSFSVAEISSSFHRWLQPQYEYLMALIYLSWGLLNIKTLSGGHFDFSDAPKKWTSWLDSKQSLWCNTICLFLRCDFHLLTHKIVCWPGQSSDFGSKWLHVQCTPWISWELIYCICEYANFWRGDDGGLSSPVNEILFFLFPIVGSAL